MGSSMNMQYTSVFHACSTQAVDILNLFYFDIGLSIAILCTVAGLVSYSCYRFRGRDGAPEPFQNEGNTRLETLWAVIPALLLTVFLVLTALAMHTVDPPIGARKPDVTVIAHQFWWEYRYANSGVVTANELHMVTGANWLLGIESADVDHSFWVPDLGSKKDAIPGQPNHLMLKPTMSGTFLGTCTEYCGMDHALMGVRVIVQPQADFDKWVQSQLKVPDKPVGAVAQRGASVFIGHTCMNCHRIAGTAANGTVGPDLTHLADRETLGAGVLTNTVDNLTLWIEDPQKYKPGCNMPDMRLTYEQAHDVAVYLEGLK
jgi:cytochrome c oxidase subunit 2